MLERADAYFNNEVFLNDAWVNATEDQKRRALKNAENQLYRFYPKFDPETNPVPEKAVFEQAYFLMLVDETIQKAQHGVSNVSVSGISISVQARSYPISPEVKLIMANEGGVPYGVKLGRSAL